MREWIRRRRKGARSETSSLGLKISHAKVGRAVYWVKVILSGVYFNSKVVINMRMFFPSFPSKPFGHIK